MIKWIKILRMTPFSFNENKLAILRNYLFDGQQWVVWKNQMDISACGRQLFVDAQMGKARSITNFFSQMETLDPTFAEQYKQAGKIDLPGKIEVSNPCVIMLKKGKGIVKISVSDPTHKLDKILLTLDGNYDLKSSMA